MSTEEGQRLYVGIDWATAEHQVCVVDGQGKILQERVVAHTGNGLHEFLAWLEELAVQSGARLMVGIEVPRGAVVESLLERGFQVYAINPKQLDRFRDRHYPSGVKDDRRDAYVIATSLRTDERCYRRVQRNDPAVIRLRDLSRHYENVRASFQRQCNQLREQLQRFYPQALELSPAADEAWLWELLELAPTPQKASQLKPARVARLLKEHRIRRLTAEQVQTMLRQPGFSLVPGTVEAASERMLFLLPVVRLLAQQRSQLESRLDAVLGELAQPPEEEATEQRQHRDVALILSLPGVGRVVAATMLAEASQALAERDYHALRSYSGVAAVTRQSGKKAAVGMRQGCNGRLRNALYHWSRVSAQVDARSKQQYQRLRAAGHSHGRALRGVADRLLALLMAMLRDGTLYDPARRTVAGCVS